ncbi:Transient receptor potential cation channel subfamily A member 1 [Fasciola gigantica]|uniref:Transient receptor potential cation channel subfamily A member 1 n=1 Tax=Fasciola gigantica TaxID=46835 RepID=A0A504YDT5_FASGI|nr:Transient receptor potential cation channel subfamily A member 1 [Fasciola gigantica]
MRKSSNYNTRDESKGLLQKEIREALRMGLAEKLRTIFEEFPDSASDPTISENDENLTCLHEAIRRHLFKCMKVLVEVAHVDVNAKTKNGLTPLHFAAKYGKEGFSKSNEDDSSTSDWNDDSVIAYLIQRGANVDERDQNGLTPLHYAAIRDRVAAAKQLLRDGAKIECTDYEEMTPLLMAVKNQHLSMVELLLDSDADYMRMDKRHNNVLHYACQSGDGLLVEKLMKQTGVMDLLDQGNRKNETPLHLAVLSQDIQMCEYLLDKGANIHSKTIRGETVLHYASLESQLFITRLLVEQGALLDEVDDEYQTPLFKAVRGGQVNVVRLLLKRGAFVNHKDSAHQTPLILAAKLGKVDICDELLTNGADCFARDSCQNNALFYAIINKHFPVVQRLLTAENGPELLQTKDAADNSPLHIAVRTGSLKITNFLLDCNCSVLSVNSSEHTPLHVATMYGRYGIVLRILSLFPHTATQVDEDGNLPVHLAAKHGFPQVLKKLLEHSSVLNDKNGSGWTPLMFSAAHNQIDCVKLLLSEGAKVNAKDKSKFTALFMACQRGYSEVVRELLEHGALVGVRVIPTHAKYPGWNSLDIAIQEKRMDCVRLIIQSNQWEIALHNVATDDRGTDVNPLRRMIKEMPEAANLVLDRCYHDNGQPENAPDYTITFDFRYLNDVEMFSSPEAHEEQKAALQQDLGSLANKARDPATEPMLKKEHGGKGNQQNGKTLSGCHGRKLISTIELMSEHGREELLHHPVVIALLSYKWARLNCLYYVHLFTYALFLALFTSFMLLTEAPYLIKNETITSTREMCLILNQANEKAYRHNILLPKYGAMVFSVISLIAEIFQLARDRLSYFSLENVLEVVIYVLTLMTTIDSNTCMMQTGLREDWQWNCGTVGLFFSWINLLLFVRRGPIFGIFVIMFISVSLTFAKFICVFSPFLIAFALSFHLLLANQNAFKTMHNALMKTFVMAIGEVELGDVEEDIFDIREIDKGMKMIRLQNLEIAKLLNKMVDRLNASEGPFQQPKRLRSRHKARNAPDESLRLGVMCANDIPAFDSEVRCHADREIPLSAPDFAQVPKSSIERLNIDEDCDQEPVLFSN